MTTVTTASLHTAPGVRKLEDERDECLWRFRVRDFGPLSVSIDAHGGSLYRDVHDRATTKLEELYARLQ